MITKGLGTNSMFTNGYSKTNIVITFIKNNFKIFVVTARRVRFTLGERLVDFILDSRPIYFFEKERLVTFFFLLRHNMFNLTTRSISLLPKQTQIAINVAQRSSEMTSNPNNLVFEHDLSIKTFNQIRNVHLKGKSK